MKNAICWMLILVMCLTLCACGKSHVIDEKSDVDNGQYDSQISEIELEESSHNLGVSNVQSEKNEEVYSGPNQSKDTGSGRNMGDANGDDRVNYTDAMLVLRASVGLATIEQEDFSYADVDGNGKLNYSDAMKILRASVGLEELKPKDPDTTEPPTTNPPVTEPPVTEPPVTEPPVTEPPVTEPPVTEPPVTEPPVTEPPATEPPATEGRNENQTDKG